MLELTHMPYDNSSAVSYNMPGDSLNTPSVTVELSVLEATTRLGLPATSGAAEVREKPHPQLPRIPRIYLHCASSPRGCNEIIHVRMASIKHVCCDLKCVFSPTSHRHHQASNQTLQNLKDH